MRYIKVTQGKAAIVDDDDFEFLAARKWSYKQGYAVRFRNIFMHNEIMKPDSGFEVDHINGDGLDNRRANLRTSTHADNMKNQRRRSDNISGYKGVSPHSNRWRAYIYINGRYINLGVFADALSAAKAYDKAAIKYFGRFAKPNLQE